MIKAISATSLASLSSNVKSAASSFPKTDASHAPTGSTPKLTLRPRISGLAEILACTSTRANQKTLVYWLVAIFQVRRRLKANTRLEEHAQIMVYIRYPDARPGSLSSIWNQGIATPSAGSIHFQPAVYDTLEPSGRATTIKVRHLLPERRNLRGKDRKYIQIYGIQAVTLLTDDGKVELAARPESLHKLGEVVGNH